MKQITRDDLMAGKASPDDYYAQFVTDSMEGAAVHVFGYKRLRESYLKDRRMQDIPVLDWLEARPHEGWDDTKCAMRDLGDELTVAASVLILKAAARRALASRYPLEVPWT